MAGTYVDNDISAFSGKKRPEYRRLLRDIEEGAVDAIIAWHTDRLHRSPRELEEFIEICDKYRIPVETVRAGELDLKTPAGRAVARTLGAWARYESEHKSERVRRKKAELAQKGLPLGGGWRCYGYAKDKMTVIPEEAAVLDEVADRILAGESLHSICRNLNDRGTRTAAGNLWACTSLRQLLLRPRLAGISEHHTAGRVRAQWPAVILEEKWVRLVALLTDPVRRTRPGAPRRHLLSGILRCGECGGRLAAHLRRSKTREYALYHCPRFTDGRGCGRVGISSHRVEPFIVEAALSSLEHLRMTPDTAANPDDATDIAAHEADQAQLSELASLYASRTISAHEWIRARSEIEERLAERNHRIADKATHHGLRDLVNREIDFREAWPTLTIEQQRSILSLLLDRVNVARAATNHRRWDPSRLTPVWRF